MASESQRFADDGFRIQHRFWLQAVDPTEAKLICWLYDLKQDRRYAGVMRDALELFYALEQGDTSVLSRLYPWAVQQGNRVNFTQLDIEEHEEPDLEPVAVESNATSAFASSLSSFMK